ncbi:MAG: VWA domain-containing protein, partial [Candidatus Omnitrophota bacterium]
FNYYKNYAKHISIAGLKENLEKTFNTPVEIEKLKDILDNIPSISGTSGMGTSSSITLDRQGDKLIVKGRGLENAYKVTVTPLDNTSGAFNLEQSSVQEPVNTVTLSLDFSGTMDESRVKLLKGALSEFLKNLPDSMKFKLNIFGPGSGEKGAGDIKISEFSNKKALEVYVNSLPSKGRDATYLYTNMLESIKNIPDNQVLVVMTDGQSDIASKGKGSKEPDLENTWSQIIDYAKRHNITIQFVGVTEESKTEAEGFIAQCKANGADAVFYYADAFTGLKDKFAEISKDINKLKINVPKDIPFRVTIADKSNKVLYEELIGKTPDIEHVKFSNATIVSTKSTLALEGDQITGGISEISPNDNILVNVGLNLEKTEAFVENEKTSQGTAKIIFILDKSGSMSESNKLGDLKVAVKKILQKIEDKTNVALYAFSDNVNELKTLGQDKNPYTLVDNLKTENMTAGYPALKAVYSEVITNNITNTYIVFLTDGLFNVGNITKDKLYDIVEAFQGRNIRLSFIGVGPEYDNLKQPTKEELLSGLIADTLLTPDKNAGAGMPMSQLAALTGGLAISTKDTEILKGFAAVEDFIFSAEVAIPKLDIKETTLIFKNKESGNYIQTTVPVVKQPQAPMNLITDHAILVQNVTLENIDSIITSLSAMDKEHIKAEVINIAQAISALIKEKKITDKAAAKYEGQLLKIVQDNFTKEDPIRAELVGEIYSITNPRVILANTQITEGIKSIKEVNLNKPGALIEAELTKDMEYLGTTYSKDSKLTIKLDRENKIEIKEIIDAKTGVKAELLDKGVIRVTSSELVIEFSPITGSNEYSEAIISGERIRTLPKDTHAQGTDKATGKPFDITYLSGTVIKDTPSGSDMTEGSYKDNLKNVIYEKKNGAFKISQQEELQYESDNKGSEIFYLRDEQNQLTGKVLHKKGDNEGMFYEYKNGSYSQKGAAVLVSTDNEGNVKFESKELRNFMDNVEVISGEGPSVIYGVKAGKSVTVFLRDENEKVAGKVIYGKGIKFDADFNPLSGSAGTYYNKSGVKIGTMRIEMINSNTLSETQRKTFGIEKNISLEKVSIKTKDGTVETYYEYTSDKKDKELIFTKSGDIYYSKDSVHVYKYENGKMENIVSPESQGKIYEQMFDYFNGGNKELKGTDYITSVRKALVQAGKSDIVSKDKNKLSAEEMKFAKAQFDEYDKNAVEVRGIIKDAYPDFKISNGALTANEIDKYNSITASVNEKLEKLLKDVNATLNTKYSKINHVPDKNSETEEKPGWGKYEKLKKQEAAAEGKKIWDIYSRKLTIENSIGYKGYNTKIGNKGDEVVDRFATPKEKAQAKVAWNKANADWQKAISDYKNRLVTLGFSKKDLDNAKFDFQYDYSSKQYLWILVKGSINRATPDTNPEFSGMYRVEQGMEFDISGSLWQGYIKTIDKDGVSSTYKKIEGSGGDSKIKGDSKIEIIVKNGNYRLLGRMEICEGQNWWQMAKNIPIRQINADNYNFKNFEDYMGVKRLKGMLDAQGVSYAKIFKDEYESPSLWRSFKQYVIGNVFFSGKIQGTGGIAYRNLDTSRRLEIRMKIDLARESMEKLDYSDVSEINTSFAGVEGMNTLINGYRDILDMEDIAFDVVIAIPTLAGGFALGGAKIGLAVLRTALWGAAISVTADTIISYIQYGELPRFIDIVKSATSGFALGSALHFSVVAVGKYLLASTTVKVADGIYSTSKTPEFFIDAPGKIANIEIGGEATTITTMTTRTIKPGLIKSWSSGPLFKTIGQNISTRFRVRWDNFLTTTARFAGAPGTAGALNFTDYALKGAWGFAKTGPVFTAIGIPINYAINGIFGTDLELWSGYKKDSSLFSSENIDSFFKASLVSIPGFAKMGFTIGPLFPILQSPAITVTGQAFNHTFSRALNISGSRIAGWLGKGSEWYIKRMETLAGEKVSSGFLQSLNSMVFVAATLSTVEASSEIVLKNFMSEETAKEWASNIAFASLFFLPGRPVPFMSKSKISGVEGGKVTFEGKIDTSKLNLTDKIKNKIAAIETAFKEKTGRDLTLDDLLSIKIKYEGEDIDLTEIGLEKEIFVKLAVETILEASKGTKYTKREGYQLDLLEQALKSLYDGRSHMGEMSGGAGKTLVMLDILRMKMLNGEIAEIIVHNEQAVKQYISSYAEYFKKAYDIELKGIYEFKEGDTLNLQKVADSYNNPKELLIVDRGSRESLELRGEENIYDSNGKITSFRTILDKIRVRGVDEIDSILLSTETTIISKNPRIAVESMMERAQAGLNTLRQLEGVEGKGKEGTSADGQNYKLYEKDIDKMPKIDSDTPGWCWDNGVVRTNKAFDKLFNTSLAKGFDRFSVSEIQNAIRALETNAFWVDSSGTPGLKDIRDTNKPLSLRDDSDMFNMCLQLRVNELIDKGEIKDQNGDLVKNKNNKVILVSTEDKKGKMELFFSSTKGDIFVLGLTATFGSVRSLVPALFGVNVSSVDNLSLEKYLYAKSEHMEIVIAKKGKSSVDTMVDDIIVDKRLGKVSLVGVIGDNPQVTIKDLVLKLKEFGMDPKVIEAGGDKTEAENKELVESLSKKIKENPSMVLITTEKGLRQVDYQEMLGLKLIGAENATAETLIQALVRIMRKIPEYKASDAEGKRHPTEKDRWDGDRKIYMDEASLTQLNKNLEALAEISKAYGESYFEELFRENGDTRTGKLLDEYRNSGTETDIKIKLELNALMNSYFKAAESIDSLIGQIAEYVLTGRFLDEIIGQEGDTALKDEMLKLRYEQIEKNRPGNRLLEGYKTGTQRGMDTLEAYLNSSINMLKSLSKEAVFSKYKDKINSRVTDFESGLETLKRSSSGIIESETVSNLYDLLWDVKPGSDGKLSKTLIKFIEGISKKQIATRKTSEDMKSYINRVATEKVNTVIEGENSRWDEPSPIKPEKISQFLTYLQERGLIRGITAYLNNIIGEQEDSPINPSSDLYVPLAEIKNIELSGNDIVNLLAVIAIINKEENKDKKERLINIALPFLDKETLERVEDSENILAYTADMEITIFNTRDINKIINLAVLSDAPDAGILSEDFDINNYIVSTDKNGIELAMKDLGLDAANPGFYNNLIETLSKIAKGEDIKGSDIAELIKQSRIEGENVLSLLDTGITANAVKNAKDLYKNDKFAGMFNNMALKDMKGFLDPASYSFGPSINAVMKLAQANPDMKGLIKQFISFKEKEIKAMQKQMDELKTRIEGQYKTIELMKTSIKEEKDAGKKAEITDTLNSVVLRQLSLDMLKLQNLQDQIGQNKNIPVTLALIDEFTKDDKNDETKQFLYTLVGVFDYENKDDVKEAAVKEIELTWQKRNTLNIAKPDVDNIVKKYSKYGVETIDVYTKALTSQIFRGNHFTAEDVSRIEANYKTLDNEKYKEYKNIISVDILADIGFDVNMLDTAEKEVRTNIENRIKALGKSGIDILIETNYIDNFGANPLVGNMFAHENKSGKGKPVIGIDRRFIVNVAYISKSHPDIAKRIQDAPIGHEAMHLDDEYNSWKLVGEKTNDLKDNVKEYLKKQGIKDIQKQKGKENRWTLITSNDAVYKDVELITIQEFLANTALMEKDIDTFISNIADKLWYDVTMRNTSARFGNEKELKKAVEYIIANTPELALLRFVEIKGTGKSIGRQDTFIGLVTDRVIEIDKKFTGSEIRPDTGEELGTAYLDINGVLRGLDISEDKKEMVRVFLNKEVSEMDEETRLMVEVGNDARAVKISENSELKVFDNKDENVNDASLYAYEEARKKGFLNNLTAPYDIIHYIAENGKTVHGVRQDRVEISNNKLVSILEDKKLTEKQKTAEIGKYIENVEYLIKALAEQGASFVTEGPSVSILKNTGLLEGKVVVSDVANLRFGIVTELQVQKTIAKVKEELEDLTKKYMISLGSPDAGKTLASGHAIAEINAAQGRAQIDIAREIAKTWLITAVLNGTRGGPAEELDKLLSEPQKLSPQAILVLTSAKQLLAEFTGVLDSVPQTEKAGLADSFIKALESVKIGNFERLFGVSMEDLSAMGIGATVGGVSAVNCGVQALQVVLETWAGRKVSRGELAGEITNEITLELESETIPGNVKSDIVQNLIEGKIGDTVIKAVANKYGVKDVISTTVDIDKVNEMGSSFILWVPEHFMPVVGYGNGFFITRTLEGNDVGVKIEDILSKQKPGTGKQVVVIAPDKTKTPETEDYYGASPDLSTLFPSVVTDLKNAVYFGKGETKALASGHAIPTLVKPVKPVFPKADYLEATGVRRAYELTKYNAQMIAYYIAMLSYAAQVRIYGYKEELSLKASMEDSIKDINAIEANLIDTSDAEIRTRIEELRATIKDRLSAGEKEQDILDSILTEVFALTKEAIKRADVIEKGKNYTYYNVQLMGAMTMCKRMIAEMATGEGKTFTVGLSGVINALSGLGVHIVTANPALAERDLNTMGAMYEFLGLTSAVILPNGKSYMYRNGALEACTRKEAYLADITYGTKDEFGFDYLRDNMAYSKDDQVQRGRHFALVDEIDNVLIDEARTPLVISAATGKEDVNVYYAIDNIIKGLAEADYKKETENGRDIVYLTEEGVDKVSGLMAELNLPESSDIDIMIRQSLQANFLFIKDKHYIIQDKEIIILDDENRPKYGSRYGDGLHEAIEAKEHNNGEDVEVKQPSDTLASITLQSYFNLYESKAGATGTAQEAKDEFKEIYNLDVMPIPTNMPVIRVDNPGRIYKTKQEKFEATIEQILKDHESGRPVLIGTNDVDESEELAAMLKARAPGLQFRILNAKQTKDEAEIVAQAGQIGAITIATNMAGRGTDIKLGEGVKEKGGLHILGTEFSKTSERIDRQLRGRSGRNGDAGSSDFNVSLEDDIFKILGKDAIEKLSNELDWEGGIDIAANAVIQKALSEARAKIYARDYEARKKLVEYDVNLGAIREAAYKDRRDVLGMEIDDLYSLVISTAENTLNRLFENYAAYDIKEEELIGSIEELFNIRIEYDDLKGDIKALKARISRAIDVVYREKFNESSEEEIRQAVLYAIDTNFKEFNSESEKVKNYSFGSGEKNKDFAAFVKRINELYETMNASIQ